MNKITKKILIGVGILAVLVVIANLAINFLLHTYLPTYIQNNTDYKISYKSLNVDLGTGNIFSTGIKISSLKPENENITRLDGTIDTLKINRLGIYDAIVNKTISPSEISLGNPNLNIVLAKPKDQKKASKPLEFENIHIRNGNISILKHTKERFLEVKKLYLQVANLRLTEKDVEKKLPVIFDAYSIRGEDFYFRPDDVYELNANKIQTDGTQMNILQFHLKPLLSYQEFVQKFPKKRNLLEVKAKEVTFKDIALKDHKITLSKVDFNTPEIKMQTTSAKPNEKEKSFKYLVELEEVMMNDTKILILKPNGKQLFTAQSLDMNLQKLAMNEETAKGNIPFQYDKFLLKGKQLQYNSDHQEIKVTNVAVNPHTADLLNLQIKPTAGKVSKTLVDGFIKRINLKINQWAFKNNQLQLDAESVTIQNFNGSINAPEKPSTKKKNAWNGIQFPLLVRNFRVEHSNLKFQKGTAQHQLNQLNLKVNNIEFNEKTVKENLPFMVENYTFSANNYALQTNRFYKLSTGNLKVSNQNIEVHQFALKPLVSRAQFIRMIPTEKDLYTIYFNKLQLQGNLQLLSANPSILANQLTITGANVNIFRSKLPTDDLTRKPMYSELLRSIKFPMVIQNTDIQNATLVYEEDTEKSQGPGKLTFTNLQLHAKNLNSNKIKGKSTPIPIAIRCLFMGISPMEVDWNINTASMDDAFHIRGNIKNLPAPQINAFTEPYLKVKTEGDIDYLAFDFRGNKNLLNGNFKMDHRDLKVEILRQDGEKNKFLSSVANTLIKSNSKPNNSDIKVENVERDHTKSFFNFFWNGILTGLKKSLI